MFKLFLNKTQFAKSITGGYSQLDNNIKPKRNKTDNQTKNIISRFSLLIMLADCQYIKKIINKKIERELNEIL